MALQVIHDRRIDEGRIYQASAYDPIPVPVADTKAIMRNGPATMISKDVDYLAFSDAIEPIGFGNGNFQTE